jgi:hypothetical protein
VFACKGCANTQGITETVYRRCNLPYCATEHVPGSVVDIIVSLLARVDPSISMFQKAFISPMDLHCLFGEVDENKGFRAGRLRQSSLDLLD